MGQKKYITSQVDEDSELYQRFEAYVDEAGHDNKSAATRQLVKSALDQHEDDNPWHDANRPDTPMAALLYAARNIRHTAVLAMLMALVLAELLTWPLLLAPAAIAALYGSTAVVGWVIAPIARRFGWGAGRASDAATGEVKT